MTPWYIVSDPRGGHRLQNDTWYIGSALTVERAEELRDFANTVSAFSEAAEPLRDVEGIPELPQHHDVVVLMERIGDFVDELYDVALGAYEEDGDVRVFKPRVVSTAHVPAHEGPDDAP